MDLDALHAQLAVLRARVEELEGQADASVQAAELSSAFEVLCVAEEELRASLEQLTLAQHDAEQARRRYQSLFQQAPCAYLVTDNWGKIVRCNVAAGELLAVAHDTLPGKPFPVYATADGRHDLYALLGRLREGRAVHGRTVELLPRDGEPTAVLAHASPARDDGGAVIGARWTLLDLTEPLATERRQREDAERRFDTGLAWLADHVPALMSYVDADQRYRFVNGAYEKAWGVSAGDIVGKQVRELMREEDYARTAPRIKAALAGETVRACGR